MIFVTVATASYSDSELYGPYTSLNEAKQNVTDGVLRGHDGDETKYTFFEITKDGPKEIGYIRFEDECNCDYDNSVTEYFY